MSSNSAPRAAASSAAPIETVALFVYRPWIVCIASARRSMIIAAGAAAIGPGAISGPRRTGKPFAGPTAAS